MFEYAVILLFPVSAGVEKKKIKGKLNKLLLYYRFTQSKT